jgi:hypothetical protein
MLEQGGRYIWNNQAYIELVDNVRTAILGKFKSASSDSVHKLQEEVQRTLINILYTDGMLGKLKLKGISLVKEPAIEWLDTFQKEELAKYPVLQGAFKSIVDFRMNIEGYLYIKCIQSVNCLRPNNAQMPEITGRENNAEIARKIIQSIFSLVGKVQENMKKAFGIRANNFADENNNDELKQPNILMWCMADTFEQEIRFGRGDTELRNFYRNNFRRICSEQFLQIQNLN